MYTFKIYHIKTKDRHDKKKDVIFKCIKLNPKFGGKQAYRNGITTLVFDLLLNNKLLKSRLNYGHDGNPELFVHYISHWLDSWYTACEQSQYMWREMSFCPDLSVHEKNIIKTETKRIENYDSLKAFLSDFCIIDWSKKDV